MGRKYEIPLALHKKLKEDFLAGRTIREMGIEHQMQNLEVLSFIRWTAKEFKLEQLLRIDQALNKLMALALELLNQANIDAKEGHIGNVDASLKQLDKVLNRFAALAGERELLSPDRKLRTQDPKTGKFMDKGDTEGAASALEEVLDGEEPGE